MKALIFTVGFILSMNCYAAAAQAKLESRSGSRATGTVDFQQANEGLRIDYNVQGLKPNGTFGFHIHEKGDCSSADAKSAGSHYHKLSETGGTSKDTPGTFAGDLPQLRSNSKGEAKGNFTITRVSLNQTNPVAGRAIMVHDGPDDVSKPSAPRIACGVIISGAK